MKTRSRVHWQVVTSFNGGTMRRSAFVLGAFLAYAQPTWAILPPLYEGLQQLKAIIEDPQLTEELQSGDLIEAIERNESGWEIRTNHFHLQVDVHRKPQSHPGPASFEYQFHKAEKE